MAQPRAADTIFAHSSGGLPSGVAVIRISGPRCRSVMSEMTRTEELGRMARLVQIRDASGALLDRGLAMFFAGPVSFTGEDCGELHVHGGRAVVASVLNALATYQDVRQAEAGEFTRRAFLNGKIDLTRAEALADLIAAETESERRLAISNSGGEQDRLYSGWRACLIALRARIEAELDFSDEEDVSDLNEDGLVGELSALASEIAAHMEGFRIAEVIRDGFRVVIVGPPNAGKSTLLNALAGREAAIVTAEAGTTRDLVEVTLDLGGQKVVLTDTAGLREANDEAERIGIERARAAAGSADLVLELRDCRSATDWRGVEDWKGPAVLRLVTKTDLLTQEEWTPEADMALSARDGTGLDELVSRIQAHLGDWDMPGRTLPTRPRHLDHLGECVGALSRAEAAIGELELCAEELRIASDALGRLTGAVDVEELLGVIFSTFCIGK